MPALINHHVANVTKLLLIGESGSGKTSALASLARAGYNLRIADFDNGTDILANLLRNEPEAQARVVYEPLTDKLVASNGETRLANAQKSAFKRGLDLFTHWKMGETLGPSGEIYPAYDLGKPADWGADTVLVVDSLTMLSNAAQRYTDAMFPAKDKRMAIYNAQQYIEQVLALLYSDAITCNVIVLAHVKEITDEDGDVQEAYPASIGTALSKKIGAYFNNVASVTMTLKGSTEVRTINTKTQSPLLLKCTAPTAALKNYPHETGLADFFLALRGGKGPAVKQKAA